MVVSHDCYADKDRAWIAAWLEMKGDKNAPIRTAKVAERLGWPLERTETALYAAVEAGLLGTPQTRAEGRKPPAEPHTVAYSYQP